MSRINRRRFLVYASAGAGAIGIGSAAPWLLRDGAGTADSQNIAVQRTAHALGTSVKITAVHDNQQVAETAITAALNELETVENVMSIYRPGSQLSELNRTGRLENPHPYLLDILTAANELSQRTDGAFDITVQPLWQLYQQAKEDGKLPTDGQIATALQQVDWKRLKLGKRSIAIAGRGGAITLNGIAQGYAADRAALALRSHGVAHALIDTGELSASGENSHGETWQIGIQHPREEDAYLSLAKLDGRCLATSGDYATTFGNGYSHHHLLDPRTGLSPQALSSVSIAAPSAMQADALSTAVFILGPDAGAKLVAETTGADALLVLKNGRTLKTANFPAV